MEIYDFIDYKPFVLNFIALQPRKGRGQLSKMAEAMSVNSSLLSQVFNGDRHLTEEQAYHAAEFLALNTKETFYFILLVQKERAGHLKLKKLLENQIHTQQKESKFLKNRITPEKDLTLEQQAIFYSNWVLTAIYTLSSIEAFGSVQEFSRHLNISTQTAKKAVDTLLEFGLCVEKNGRISEGPKSTFISGDSPLVSRHHANWRIQALEKMTDYHEGHFHYTMPYTISTEDYHLFRKELVKLIENLGARIRKTSAPEEAVCLNIDYFKF